jgi:hypothetical protein
VRQIRDHDSIYGSLFDARVRNLCIEQLVVAPRAPWEKGCAERFVGTLRRELLDHVIVLGERHLLRLVQQHASYCNEDRPHMALDRDAAITRTVQPPSGGKVVSLPRIGGLPPLLEGRANCRTGSSSRQVNSHLFRNRRETPPVAGCSKVCSGLTRPGQLSQMRFEVGWA